MKKLIPFFMLFLLAGCHKEGVIPTSELDAPLVTGFHPTDNAGNPGIAIGNPNIHDRELRNGILYMMTAYPNPTSGIVIINISVPSQVNNDTKIWITRARIDESLSQFNFAGSNQMVVSGNPVIKLDDIPPQTYSFRFDLTGLPAGAYRAYVLSGEVLLWTNILLQK